MRSGKYCRILSLLHNTPSLAENIIFHELFNVRTFKQAVPIHEYDDMKPYIERIMHGEQNVLWNTPIYWFAKSSGTTSDKSKFIPISEESLEDCHFKAAKDVLTLYYNFNPDSDLLTGKGSGDWRQS